MFKLRNKIKRLMAVTLTAFIFSMVSISAVHADEPSGPASDTQIAVRNDDAATGPGALSQETQPGAEQVQPPVEQPQVPTEQPQPPAEQLGTDSDASGKIMSGGRLIDPSAPMIALTFDDGPYAPVGNKIMDCLEQHNGRSTFFVVGNRVHSYKSEIKRMHDSGHEVANHTYEHKYLTGLSAAGIRSQIEKCNEAVAAVTGEAPTLVRLPGGLKNATVLANVHYPMIMWNIDTMDWKTKNAQKSIHAVLGKVQDGDIILMHELYTPSGEAAAAIIQALTEQGYQLVTVSEMAKFRGGVAAGKLYNKFRP
ncbi:MAG: polysaccharide deacetylase family protein [Clostridium sp.]